MTIGPIVPSSLTQTPILASRNGKIILTPTGLISDQITDFSGNVWTVDSSGNIDENGTQKGTAATGTFSALLFWNGQLYWTNSATVISNYTTQLYSIWNGSAFAGSNAWPEPSITGGTVQTPATTRQNSGGWFRDFSTVYGLNGIGPSSGPGSDVAGGNVAANAQAANGGQSLGNA